MARRKNNNSEDEAERRRKVAEEKVWGSLIEAIDMMRKQPVTYSIVMRLYLLYHSIFAFLMTSVNSPLKTDAPALIIKQTNFLIRTYNDVIEDFHKHFDKKDDHVTKSSLFKELDEPIVNDVTDNSLYDENKHFTNYKLSD
jgi:hypothetical protein